MSDRVPKYTFYEKVVAVSNAPTKSDVNRETGAVLGMTETDYGSWYYTVYIYSQKRTLCFFEHELSPTGEFASRDEFYDGKSMRISVDDQRRGRLEGGSAVRSN